jgi:ubiquinone/menaquinone biosynthesis C-methylase UbiE
MKPHLAVLKGATQWQLTRRAARHYEACLVPVLFEPWAIDLVNRCEVIAGSRVLDLACGTGAVARVAASKLGPNGEIVGLDGSRAMLAIARRRCAPGARVEWRIGDAASLPFSDDSFDAVLCQQGFQFLADRQRALVEIARVLRPNGRLALSIWCGEDRNPLGAALISTIDKYFGELYGDVVRRPFSFRNWVELRSMITALEFRVTTARIVTQLMHARDAAAFLAGQLSALPFDVARGGLPFGELVRDLLACVKRFVHDDGDLEIPFEAYTVIAERNAR